MGLSGVSKSTVPKPCKDIAERARAFLDREFVEGQPWPWLDASAYDKV